MRVAEGCILRIQTATGRMIHDVRVGQTIRKIGLLENVSDNNRKVNIISSTAWPIPRYMSGHMHVWFGTYKMMDDSVLVR